MRLGNDVLRLDLYELLGVPPDADITRIRNAYRRRALQSHPDLNRAQIGAAEREMVDLNVAAWVLTDPELRRQYDRSRGSHPTQRSRAWYEKVCYGDTDWVVPPKQTRRRPRSEELVQLLRRLRVWPGRVMLRLSEACDALSLRQRTTLTAFCFVAAVLLIGYAKPRSLTNLFEDEVQQQSVVAPELAPRAQ